MIIDEATKQAFHHYIEMLKVQKGITESENFSESDWQTLNKTQRLKHCLWMCQQMVHRSTDHYSLDKKSRWLGFVQGILISEGLTTISNERNITRPWFTNAPKT